MTNINGKWPASSLLRAVPLVALFATGCGGAGVSGNLTGTGSSGKPTSTQVGNASFTFSGQPKAMINGATGPVGYVGQAGASFSTLAVNPTPNLNSTFLAFTRSLNLSGDQIYTASASSGWQPNLLLHQSNNGYVSVSQFGTMAYLTQTGGTYAIKTVQSDGTQIKTVISGVAGVPAISPNGGVVAYIDSLGNLYTISVNGGTPTKIYSGGNAGGLPVWSPNNSQIAFSTVSTSTVTGQVWTLPVTGGTPTNVTPSNYSNNGNTQVSGWSPDGQTLVCMYNANGATNWSLLTLSVVGGYSNLLTPTGFSDVAPTFSPDNEKIAFYRTNAGGAIPGIYIEDFVGTNPRLVIPDPDASGATGGVVNISWSPFLENQKFVGPGGSYSATPVSGFVLAQVGSQFGSMVTMTATTPSTASITPPVASTPSGPIMLTLKADAITNIIFGNVYNGSHTSLTLTAVPTAIVSLDGSTGAVDFVAPGRVLRHGPPTPGLGRSELSGQFSAIYDGTGKNIAPNGASTLEVDAKSGKLISFR